MVESILDQLEEGKLRADKLTAVVSRAQVDEAVANDEAITDCIYSLDQALRKDRITIDVYLKKVREMSREQFSCRLLVCKIQEREKMLADMDKAKIDKERLGVVGLPRQQSLP